jgi:hypothetical protein
MVLFLVEFKSSTEIDKIIYEKYHSVLNVDDYAVIVNYLFGGDVSFLNRETNLWSKSGIEKYK